MWNRLPPLSKLERNLINNPQEEPILIYEGRIPQFAVMYKLFKILDLAFVQDNYPILSRKNLVEIICHVAGDDVRTLEKYLRCFRTFIMSRTGQQISYYSNWDLSYFHSNLLLIKQVREKQSLTKQDERIQRANSRSWCTKCRRHKRLSDGGCRCAI